MDTLSHTSMNEVWVNTDCCLHAGNDRKTSSCHESVRQAAETALHEHTFRPMDSNKKKARKTLRERTSTIASRLQKSLSLADRQQSPTASLSLPSRPPNTAPSLPCPTAFSKPPQRASRCMRLCHQLSGSYDWTMKLRLCQPSQMMTLQGRRMRDMKQQPANPP